MRSLLVVVTCLWWSSQAAHAEVHQRVAIVLGVRLTPAQAAVARAHAAELRQESIEIFEDPSKYDGAPPPPTPTTYVGRQLSSQDLGHNTPQATATPLPDAEAIAKLRSQLIAAKLPGELQLIAVVVYSGGK